MRWIILTTLFIAVFTATGFSGLHWYAGADGGWGTITEKHEPFTSVITPRDADWGVYRSEEWIFDWLAFGCDIDGRINIGIRGGIYLRPKFRVGTEITMLQFWGNWSTCITQTDTIPGIPDPRDDPFFGYEETTLLRYTNYFVVIGYEPWRGFFIESKIGWGTNYFRNKWEHPEYQTMQFSEHIAGPTAGAAIGWSQPVWRGLAVNARIGWTIQWYDDDSYIRTEIGTANLGLTWKSN
ncbi:hypothetical protein DRQ36_08955 [bacterium]|nr:MAG: hypothetical protein DRQ36_08955 [bacterium]